MKFEDKRTPVGLDTDTDPLYIAIGKYTDAMDIRVGSSVQQGGFLSAENIPSHVLNAYTPPVGGDYSCIGKIEDDSNNKVYYFLCDSSANKYHRIVVYDYINSTAFDVAVNPNFNFDYNYLITGASIINNDIFWTDGRMFPMHTSLLGDYTTSESNRLLEEYDLCKHPPLYPPVFEFRDTVGTGDTSPLNRGSYQFMARYVYANGMKTPFSYASELACAGFEINKNFGTIRVGLKCQNNENATQLPAASHPTTTQFATDSGTELDKMTNVISYIEFAVRDKYTFQWKLAKRIVFPTSATATATLALNSGSITVYAWFDFKNDEAYTVIPEAETLYGFDDVPLLSRTGVALENRWFLGSNTKGYNSLENNANILAIASGATVSTQTVVLLTDVVDRKVFLPYSIYQAGVEVFDYDLRKSLAYTSNSLKLITKGQTTGTSYSNVLTYYLGGINFTCPNTGWERYYALLISENLTVGWFVQARVENVLYSAGRDINNNPRFTKQIGGIYDLSTTPGGDYKKTFEEANAYRLSTYYQDKYDYTVDPNTTVDYALSSEVLLDIGNLLKYGNNIPYTYTKGDRVRLISKGGTTDGLTLSTDDYLIKEYYKDRFISIDIPATDNSVGVSVFDDTTGGSGIRVKVVVTRKGEVWYGDEFSSYDNLTKIKTFTGFTLTGVNIINGGAVGSQLRICITGADGFCKYASGVNGSAGNPHFTSSTVWTDVPFVTIPSTTLITRITSFNITTGSKAWFVMCGTDGFVGFFNPYSLVATIQPFTSTQGNINTWYLTGISSFGYDATGSGGNGANYIVVSAKDTEQIGGIGITNFDLVTGLTTAAWNGVTTNKAWFTNYSESTLLNDVAALENQPGGAFPARKFGIFCVGKSSAGQGQIESWLYNEGSLTISRDSYNQKDSVLPQEFTCITLRAMNNAQTIGITAVNNAYIFYIGTISGQIFTIGGATTAGGYNNIFAKGIAYNISLLFEWTQLYYAIINSNNATYLSGIVNPNPLDSIGYISGNPTINNIYVNGFNATPSPTSPTEYDTFFTGVFYGYGKGINLFQGNNQNSILQITSFVDETTTSILNYKSVIQIYSPKPQNTERLFYESVLTTNDTTTTKYRDKSSNLSSATIGYDNEGDCYLVKKNFSGRLWSSNTIVYSMSPDDTNTTGSYIDYKTNNELVTGWIKGNNRPTTTALNIEKQTDLYTEVALSEQYVVNTSINGTNTFYPLNAKTYPIEYGKLRAMVNVSNTQEDGNILLCIFEHESASVYINKVQYTDASSSGVVSVSEQVLGTFRALRGGYGTVHPESVDGRNGMIYWFDANKGKFIRYAQNGLTPISDYGAGNMQNYALAKGAIYLKRAFNRSGYERLLGFYNPRHREMEWTFSAVVSPSTSAETIVWSESQGSFISKRSYYPEMAAKINQTQVMWKNGLLYICDGSSNYGGFLGAANGTAIPYIEFVFNKNQFEVKVWQSLQLEASTLWELVSTNNDSSQNTELLGLKNDVTEVDAYPQDWIMRETNYWAAFLRDKNTPNLTYPLLDGDVIRGQWLKAKLQLPSGSRSTRASLTSVSAFVNPSQIV